MPTTKTKLYKVVTAAGSVEYVNAERSERNDNAVSLFVGDEEVGYFVGASSVNVVEEVKLPEK